MCFKYVATFLLLLKKVVVGPSFVVDVGNVLELIARSVFGRLGLLAVQHNVELLVLSTDQELLQWFPVAVERLAP